MFAGINSSAQDSEQKIAKIISREKEEIELQQGIEYLKSEKVNLWLDQLQEQMKTSLGRLTEKAIE